MVVPSAPPYAPPYTPPYAPTNPPPYFDGRTENRSNTGVTSSRDGDTNNLDKPDILQNLQWKQQEKHSYSKEKVDFEYDRKNISFGEKDIPEDYSKVASKPKNRTDRRVGQQRRTKRAFAIFGWIFCCPLMALGMTMRERPVDNEDLRDDPCLPCMYESNPDLAR